MEKVYLTIEGIEKIFQSYESPKAYYFDKATIKLMEKSRIGRPETQFYFEKDLLFIYELGEGGTVEDTNKLQPEVFTINGKKVKLYNIDQFLKWNWEHCDDEFIADLLAH